MKERTDGRTDGRKEGRKEEREKMRSGRTDGRKEGRRMATSPVKTTTITIEMPALPGMSIPSVSQPKIGIPHETLLFSLIWKTNPNPQNISDSPLSLCEWLSETCVGFHQEAASF